MLKKTLSAICALLLVFSLTTSTASQAMSIQASRIIFSTSAYIVPRSGGFVEGDVTITAYENCSTIGFTYVAIEEYRNGVWTPVATKSYDTTTGFSHGSYLSYYGTKGLSYRITCTAVASYGGTTEYRYPSATTTAI